MAKLLLNLILILLLNSCSCEWHLKKLESKCGKFTSDTLTVHDTLVTTEVKKDTVFKYFQRDTVIIREGKLTMKYFYNRHDSTVFQWGKCASDTIIKEIKVPYEKASIKVDYFPPWLKYLVYGLLILGIVFWAYRKFFS